MRMRKSFVLTLVAGLVALLSAGSEPVFAASSTCPGATCTTGPVPLDFRVIIPGIVRLQIGAAGGTTLQFDTPASNVGDGTAVNATGGDSIIPNEVTVLVQANSGAGGTGSVDVTAATSGGGIACQSGGCDTVTPDRIDWNEISVTESGCNGVQPPILNNAGTGITNFPAVGGTIFYSCGWRFAYLNTTVPPAGTYFGTVTYTATGQP